MNREIPGAFIDHRISHSFKPMLDFKMNTFCEQKICKNSRKDSGAKGLNAFLYRSLLEGLISSFSLCILLPALKLPK